MDERERALGGEGCEERGGEVKTEDPGLEARVTTTTFWIKTKTVGTGRRVHD